MKRLADCFLSYSNSECLADAVRQLSESKSVNDIYIFTPKGCAGNIPDGCKPIEVDNPQSSAAMRAIAENVKADYALLLLSSAHIVLGPNALQRLMQSAVYTQAAMTYGDYAEEKGGAVKPHPVIDCQKGSIRDDFDFGPLVLIETGNLLSCLAKLGSVAYTYAGWYALRLALSRCGAIYHLREKLCTILEEDEDKAGEQQFDYVNPRNREVQREMEKAVTAHLDAIGALVDTSRYKVPDFQEQPFTVEASVVIPVFNREKTISDAVESALSQKATFKFNVIVVDNHSTDGTTAILQRLAESNSRLVHLVPQRRDLGIGGCWNEALNDSRCGRFAVQLDSDDLYSSTSTLQSIVDAFYSQGAAMIVGAYRLCDFSLNTLPPGLIDHKEWTAANGCNNALRINGLGAPRAFFTPLARQIGFPNTSYGEDYAMGLAFSRHWRIGRIYHELYLCRRWTGNSDHQLSIEKQNANNEYKDSLRTMEIDIRQKMYRGENDPVAANPLERFFERQLQVWPEAGKRYKDLRKVVVRELPLGDNLLKVQFNPARIVSTGASISKSAVQQRPCFLCDQNRPKEQMAKHLIDRFQLLVNPFPIMPAHFTVPATRHQPQLIIHHYNMVGYLLHSYPELTVFYNGPKCGASAPDHLHFQAFTGATLPLQQAWQRLSRNLTVVKTTSRGSSISIINGYVCPAIAIQSTCREDDEALFRCVYSSLPQHEDDTEPMMNVLSWMSGNTQLTVVFPRAKHRPDCYYAEGEEKMLVSPGAIDMAGLIITPRKEDFDSLTPALAQSILQEVSVDEASFGDICHKIEAYRLTKSEVTVKELVSEPVVSVGIVNASSIDFTLNTPYLAKGERIAGAQTVRFSEGGIEWNGNLYRELRFSPLGKDASFSISNVVIGKNFHWERRETQVFQGSLHIVVDADNICAINELPVESYLASVISSEMSGTSSLELLKAHAVISRSWLLAQMQKRRALGQGTNNFFSFTRKDDELIRWYDREDHTIFDVCADDHCQRYQGITKAGNPHVAEAVKATRGQILMDGTEICDARFSKCCGGVTEEFQYCWENKPKSYLKATRDAEEDEMPDLTVEASARKWIMESPKAFCNTTDKHILSQVLNDYDQETPDFYRWQVVLTQQQIQQLLEEKQKLDFGDVLDLVPVERGKSGRISKLKIVGSKLTFTIGKELEIRRSLSKSHLYSSAFVVDKENVSADGVPGKFILHGAGWGHGVGLCQIGAAVMGAEGYDYKQILLHYYDGAEIKKIYK